MSLPCERSADADEERLSGPGVDEYAIEVDVDGRRRAVYADGSFTYRMPGGA